ncbi:MAG: hypothetical protein P8J33_14200, partial [Pirellulaceae bacterium]|nr:hypothetical protein [Pirellulaceae bacterium]
MQRLAQADLECQTRACFLLFCGKIVVNFSLPACHQWLLLVQWKGYHRTCCGTHLGTGLVFLNSLCMRVYRLKPLLLSQFEKDGFVCCRRFTSVASISEGIERVIRDVVPGMPSEHVFYEDRAQPDSLKQLQLLQQHDAFFEALAKAGPFR